MRNCYPHSLAKSFLLLLLIGVLGISKVGAQIDIAIGTGTAGNLATSTGADAYPCPLQDYYEGHRGQYLYRATELISAGMGPGAISAIKFNVVSLGTAGVIEQFQMKIGTTSANSLGTSTWETVSNTVVNTADYQAIAGINTFTFTTPFFWNGVDNIVVEVCNGDPNNSSSVTFTSNAVIPWTTGLSFNGSHNYRADNIGNACGTTTTTNTGTQTTRPNIIFTWNSAVACSGVPNAGTTTSTQTNIVCAGTPFTLSLTGNTLASGLTYQWQSATSNSGPWYDISGATTYSYTMVQSLASVFYRCLVTCTNGGGNSTSVPVQVTSSTGPQYATFPFSESFEATWINGCGTRDIPNQYWKNTPFTGANSWRRDDDGTSAGWANNNGIYAPVASNGLRSARFHSWQAPSASTGSLDVYLNCNTYTPFKRVSFDYINTSGSDSLIIELSTDGGVSFSRLDGVALATVWTNTEIYFSSLSATTIVRFKGKSDIGATDIGLDNIKINNWADCNGTPTGGSASAAPTTDVCAGVPIKLAVGGASDGNSITYQWQVSTDGGTTWTNIPGETNFTATVFQTVTSMYRCVTNCTTTSLTANSTAVTVTSKPLPGGTYTINSSSPTDFYTGGTNFNSFNDAYNTLKCGIKSSVIFDVQTGANAGIYTEQLIMNGQIPNSSATRTVTFKGNGKTLKFNASVSADRAVIKLKNISYIIFDSLVVDATSGTYGWGIQLSNDADSNVIRKCTINSSATGTTAASFAGIVINGSDTDPIGTGTTTALSDFNIIDGNTINGGVYGITLTATFAGGANGFNQITNNNVRNFYNYGLYVNGSYNTLIENNWFSRPTRTGLGEFTGIYFTGQSNTAFISKNRIFNPCGGAVGNTSAFTGINFNSSSASSGNANIVRNNLIYGVNNNAAATGLANTSSSNVSYFHNTISLDSLGTTTSANTRGYSQTGTSDAVYFFNNLISVTRGGNGIKYCVYTTQRFTFADNNNYYIPTASSNYVGFFGANRTTIADWKTVMQPFAIEGASLSVIPVYTDPSYAVADYHPNNSGLNDKGVYIGIDDDITNAVRNQLTPDIGAYEFIPAPCSLPLVTGTTTMSVATICQNQPVVLGLSIGAYGSSQTFQWQTSPTGAAPWTTIGNPMQVPDTTILSTTTLYYQCIIKCGSVSDVSAPTLLTVTPGLQTGIYTINSANPTSSSPILPGANFNSFADAKAAMNCGVVGTGNVVFNVLTGANNGLYNEQLVLDSIKGVNVNRQVIFNGNGNTIAFSSSNSAERAVIKLKAADFITFDSLRIDATGAGAYGYGVQLLNNADSNTFRRCVITTSSTIASTSYAGVVINATDAGVITSGNTHCDGNIFDKDSIKGGYYGITLVGSAAQLVANNEFTNNYISDFFNYGIYLVATYNTKIEGNMFTRPFRTVVGTAYPIYFTTIASTRVSVSKNRITKLFGGAPSSTLGIYGIYHNNVPASAGNECVVSNNALYNLDGAGFIYGFYNVGSGNVFYHHNTISIDNATPANATSVGLYQSTDAVGIQFYNNMVTIRRAVLGNPIKQGIFLSTATTEVFSDYNNILVSGTGTNNFIGYRAGTNYTTLAAWRAATQKDINSFNFDPVYDDTANGSFKPQMFPLNDKGTPLSYTTDIINAPRSFFIPDIGAWEFAPIPCAVPPVAGTASVTPNSGLCLEQPIRLSLTGHSPLGSITFQWQASLTGTDPWVDLGAPLYSPTFDTLTSVTRFYRCKVICNGNFTYSNVVSVALNTIVLAGTYTIDGTLPATWISTGGAVGTNFQTVQSAVDAIKCGMTGSVVFNVKGTFNEQIRIPYIPGTSAGTTVTFQSYNGQQSGAELTSAISTNANNYTLKLDSCKYFTFRNMTISNTSTNFGRVVDFANTASYDSLSGCLINAPVTTNTANSMSAVFATALKGTNIVIKGNTINNGSSGVNFSGTSVAVPAVDHFIDSNFVNGAFVYGIYANLTQRIKIRKNTVNVAAPVTATSYGIYAIECDSSYIIANNKVNINNTTSTVYGVYLTACDGSAMNRGKVTGNDVVAETNNTGTLYGIWLNNNCPFADVLNNTVSINTAGATSYGLYHNNGSNINYYNNSILNQSTGTSNTRYAAYFLNGSSTSVNVKNNIFSHKGGGKAMYMASTASGTASDYNLLHTTGTNLVERAGTNFTTLQAWVAASALDKFSMVYNPAFTSNLNLRPDLANVDVWAIHGRGTQIPDNTYDHDGNARPTTLVAGVPDLGAYEFYPTALPTVLTATPAAPAANTEQVFMYGTDTVMKLKWGATAPPSIEVRRYSGVVPSGLAAVNLDSMYFYTKVDIPGGGNYDYDARLYYLDPWLGSIGGLVSGVYQLGLGKTQASNAWIVGSTSRNDVNKRMIYQNSVNFLDRFTGLVNPYAPPLLPDKDSSNRGRRFWVAYAANQLAGSQDMVLYLSAGQDAANVQVKINGTTWVRNYTVPANTVVVSDILPKAAPVNAFLNAAGLFDYGISINSDVPIVAYSHTYGSASSGACMLLPVGVWGYEYKTLGITQNYGANSFSYFYVIADNDNTVVDITPTVGVQNAGMAAGAATTVTLNKGQVFQVIATSQTQELTGSTVKSVPNSAGKCYPIATFSGSTRTGISLPCGGGGDFIMQQNFPATAWGKRYLTAPSQLSTTVGQTGAGAVATQANLFRIAVKDPNTIVKRNDVQLTGLVNNHYYQYQSSTADYIESDGPIMVAQYLSGACTGVGDPEMIYISPIEQGINNVGFYRNTVQSITTNHLTMIVPTAGMSSLVIKDGNTIVTPDAVYDHAQNALTTTFNNTSYKVVVKNWTSAQSQVTVTCDSNFTGITYGLGSVESYGYNIGTKVKNLQAAVIVNPLSPVTTPVEYTCAGSPFRFSMTLAVVPTSITWKLSQVPNLKLHPSGANAVDVQIFNPSSSGQIVVNGQLLYKFELPQLYKFVSAGIYLVPITYTHPTIESCDNTQTDYIPVQVIPAPAISFSTTFAGCAGNTATFGADISTPGGVGVTNWTWGFNNGTTATGPTATFTYNTPGTYTDTLHAVTADGCLRDTTKQIVVNPIPVVAVVTDSVAICTGASATISVQSPLAGATYNWYTTLTGGSPTFTGTSHTFTNVTADSIFYIEGISAANCTSVTRKRIVVHPLPALTPVTVTVTGSTANSVTFGWTAVPGAGSYQVSTNGGTTYTVPSSGATGLTHTVTGMGVLTNTNLIVQAIGVITCQTSTSSSVAGCTNSAPIITPDSVAICLGNSYTYLVNAPLPANVVNTWYTVPAGGTALTSGTAYTINASGSSFTANSLSPAGVYTYYTGHNNTVTGCVGTLRKRVVINVLAPLAKPVVPVPVVTPSTPNVITPNSITFSWAAVTGAVGGYEVSINNGTSWTTPSSGSAGLTHTVSGLAPNTSVTILVRALGYIACQTSISDPTTAKTFTDAVYVPNAFNPSSTQTSIYGTDNRTLRVYGYVIQSMTFMVFNQWGEKVFESNNQSSGWDGIYKGKPQPSGVYIYLLRFTTNNGETKEMKGSVSLIR